MISYWITLSIILAIIMFLSMIYFGLIFKNTKIYNLLKHPLTMLMIKKVVFAIFTLFLITISIFLITEMIPQKYFNDANFNEMTLSNNSSIINKLLNYLYNILPVPKKICTSTYLSDGKLTCSTYEYTLINLGTSQIYMKNIPVLAIIKEKSIISFHIGISAYILQCLIGYPLGIYLAKKENKLIDKFYNIFHIVIKIIPTIVYFYIFVILFMVVFKLPVLFEADDPITYIAPLTALTLCSSLSIAYFVRKYILLEMNKDYVTFAISKGLDKNTILYRHIIRNSIVPFIRTIPTSILLCFSGFYILEASFNIPGIGLTLIYAIQLKDIDLIRGLIIFFSLLSIIAYLIGDLLTVIFKRKKSIDEGGIKNG